MNGELRFKVRQRAVELPCRCGSVVGIYKDFYQYSVEFKKMTIVASKAECQHIRAFLKYIDENDLNNFSSITVTDIRQYIINNFQGLKPSTIGRYIISLRNFFRFLEYSGNKVDTAIFLLPMTSANWKSQNIPITLENEEELNLRNHTFPDTELGVRNKVILLLLLDLGLRCSEIPAIRLHSFYMPSEDVELVAVFNDTAETPTGTAIIESVKATSNKLSFVSVLNVPKNCKFVKGGLVAATDATIGESVDASNAQFVKLSTKATANSKNVKYTWTKSVSGNTVVYVRAYLVYKDSSGAEHEIYGDCVKANSSGIIY